MATFSIFFGIGCIYFSNHKNIISGIMFIFNGILIALIILLKHTGHLNYAKHINIVSIVVLILACVLLIVRNN